jgi:Domain of unknown function (DUF4440)
MPFRTIEGIKLQERLFLKALTNGDVGTLDALWAEDYAFTGPDGTHFDKADCLACVAEGRLKFDAFNLEFIDGEIQGEAAVVRCCEHVRGRFESFPFDAVMRHVSIYSRLREGWQQVSTIVPFAEYEAPQTFDQLTT